MSLFLIIQLIILDPSQTAQKDVTLFVLSQAELSRLSALSTAKMTITRGVFPRCELELKAARKVSGESLLSAVRRRLTHHSPHEEVDFVYLYHLTTQGNS